MLLEHVKNINFVDEELETEFVELTESFNTIIAQLNEETGRATFGGLRMPPPGKADERVRNNAGAEGNEVDNALETAVKQMVAVKKAMVILNRMPDSESRTRNKSRVMGNLNRIRGSLQRVAKMLAQSS